MQIETELTPGGKGQFDVIADGHAIATRGGNWFTRGFGFGYPNTELILSELAQLVNDASHPQAP